MSRACSAWTAGWARHCPRCGAAGFHSGDGRRHCCDACGLEYFHNLAAAVCALIFCGGELALIVRGQDPGRGLLDLPGGFVDPGESLETAVHREVREELALTLPPPRYLFSLPNTYHYRGVDYWTLDAMFMFTIEARPTFTPNPEVQDLQWWSLPAIAPDALAFDSVRTALGRLRDEGVPGVC